MLTQRTPAAVAAVARRRRWQSRAAAIALLCCLGPALATTINVNTTADEYGSGPSCSLREAIHASETQTAFGGCSAGSGLFGDLIVLPAGHYSITRSPTNNSDANYDGDFNIANRSVSIQGQGAGLTIIDGNHLDRIFSVGGGLISPALLLQSVTLSGGLSSGSGGAIKAYSGTLSIQDTLFDGNQATFNGGAISTSDGVTLTITRSTIAHNRAQNGGGLDLVQVTSAALKNVTISGNVAQDYGGGIDLGFSGDTTLNNVTISDNTNHLDGTYFNLGGAGINFENFASHTDTLTIHNSIIAGNTTLGVNDSSPDCDTGNDHVVTSAGHNLIGTAGNCTRSGATLTDLVGFDPKLLPLFNYGGPLPTHALLPESPAIDAGSGCETTDERGIARPQGAGCDIGAYEYHVDFTVDSFLDGADIAPGDGTCQAIGITSPCTLRAALQEANLANGFRTIYLPPGDYRLSIPYTPGHNSGTFQIAPTYGVLLLGAGSDKTRIRSVTGETALLFFGGAATVARMSIAGTGTPPATSEYAGVSQVEGNTLLYQVEIESNSGCAGGLLVEAGMTGIGLTIADNVADSTGFCPIGTSGGGIAVSQQATLTLLNSTISGNKARQSGGGIYNAGGNVYLSHVTVADNLADFDAAGGGDGGGIARGASGTFFVGNSIIGGNRNAGGGAVDCAAVVSSFGYNMIQDTTGCTIGGTLTGNLTGQSPLLSSLTRQGGPTRTQGLLPGSLALNRIPPAACVDIFGYGIAADQRGTPRLPHNNNTSTWCDSGAFEGVSDVIFADGWDKP